MKKDFKQEKGTYIISENNTTKLATYFFFALIFLALFAIMKNGLLPYLDRKTDFGGLCYPLLFLLTSSITTLLTTLLVRQIRKETTELQYVKSLNLGLLLGLILPLYTPLWVVVLAGIMTILCSTISKKLWNRNIIPPVLVGWFFVMGLSFLHIIPALDYLNPSEIGLGLPLDKLEGLGTYHQLVRPYGSLLDFFIGLIPGAMGVTSILLCIIAYGFLTAKGVIKWRIPLVTVATVFIITYMIGEFNHLGLWYPVFHTCTGMLVFGSIFLASTPENSPTTPIGQLLYALTLGVIIVALRYFTPLTDATMFGILIVSIIGGLFDYIGAIARFNFNKSVIPFLILWIMILFLGVFLGIHYLDQTKEKDVEQPIKALQVE